MALEFLRDTPERAFRKIEADLRMMNPDLDMRVYKRMSSAELVAEAKKLTQRESHMIDTQPYGAWLSDPDYIQTKFLNEALIHLAEYKRASEAREVLAPGFTYYRNVKQFGHKVEGEMCHYLGESRPANWIKFTDAVPVMKALEVIRHGNSDDFRKLYIEMADGRTDALENLCIEHITESTNGALARIEQYCDSRWQGAWPWETATPFKLKKMIEDKQTMKMKTLAEMQQEFSDLLNALMEGEAEKFEVLTFAKDMQDKIQAMIENLARLAGEGIITLKDKTRTVMGDEAAMQVEHSLAQQINLAADALSKLRVSVDGVIKQLESAPAQDGMGGGIPGGAPGGMPAPGPDGMVANPMAAGDPTMGGGMGGEPGLDDGLGDDGALTDNLADVPPVEPERPKKGK